MLRWATLIWLIKILPVEPKKALFVFTLNSQQAFIKKICFYFSASPDIKIRLRKSTQLNIDQVIFGENRVEKFILFPLSHAAALDIFPEINRHK